MNVKELIKKYENILKKSVPFTVVNIHGVLRDLKQLDEPQKPVVPQFVADVIEDLREDSSELEQAFQSAWWYESDDFTEWYKKKSNRNAFGLAWLGGYEVEKEKRYRVKAKGKIEENLLVYGLGIRRYFFSRTYDSTKRGEHTRKELEDAGFGWVFDCPGIEIEEVE